MTLAAATQSPHLELPYSQGINVILGENGTGKTRLLQSMYALASASGSKRALFLPEADSYARLPSGGGEQQPEFAVLLEELEGIIGGPVRNDGDALVVDARRGPVPLSEGHQRLACLAYLIKNGALTAKSVLFWDGPEAGLGPKLVTVVATMLRKLADAGVQIFMATHNYLLARELSLAAQYRIPPFVDTIFFSLHRPSAEAPVEVESNRLWSHLGHNPIVEEYSAHYDREQDLFAT